MSLTAYIRYDSQGRIVPGGPIVTKTKPAVGNWQVVTQGTSATLVGQLRAFVKLDRFNKPLAGSLFLGKSKPATGKWLEVNATYSSNTTPTYYLYAGNFCSSGDLTFVRSTVALSINDVIYLNDGNCCTIASIHEGPNYDVDYVSPGVCFVSPCPTTTTTTTTTVQVHSFNINYVGWTVGAEFACTRYHDGQFMTMYSNVSTLVQGSILYNDPQLQNPFSGYGTEGWYAIDNNGTISSIQIGRASDGNLGVILYPPVPCTVTYPSYPVTNYNSVSDACSNNNPISSTTIYMPRSSYGVETTLWLDSDLTQPYNPGSANILKIDNSTMMVYTATVSPGVTTITAYSWC